MDRTNEMDKEGIAVFTAQDFLEEISAAHEPLAFTTPVEFVIAGPRSRRAFGLNLGKSESFTPMTATGRYAFAVFLVRKRADAPAAPQLRKGQFDDLFPDMSRMTDLVGEYEVDKDLRARIRADLHRKGLLQLVNATLAA